MPERESQKEAVRPDAVDQMSCGNAANIPGEGLPFKPMEITASFKDAFRDFRLCRL